MIWGEIRVVIRVVNRGEIWMGIRVVNRGEIRVGIMSDLESEAISVVIRILITH